MRYTHITKARMIIQANELQSPQLEGFLAKHHLSNEELESWREKIRIGGIEALKFRAGPTKEKVPYKQPKYSDLSPEEKFKASIRATSKTYYKRGKIEKTNCIICDSKKSQMHHEDYTKPYNVIWLCRPCHNTYHTGKNANITAQVKNYYEQMFQMKRIVNALINTEQKQAD